MNIYIYFEWKGINNIIDWSDLHLWNFLKDAKLLIINNNNLCTEKGDTLTETDDFIVIRIYFF